jgi:hypothetical protein
MQPIVVTSDSYHALGAWKPMYLLQKSVLKCSAAAFVAYLDRHNRVVLFARPWHRACGGGQSLHGSYVHYAACLLHPQQFGATLPFTTQYFRPCSRLKWSLPARCGHLASASILSTSLAGGVDAANSRHKLFIPCIWCMETHVFIAEVLLQLLSHTGTATIELSCSPRPGTAQVVVGKACMGLLCTAPPVFCTHSNSYQHYPSRRNIFHCISPRLHVFRFSVVAGQKRVRTLRSELLDKSPPRPPFNALLITITCNCFQQFWLVRRLVTLFLLAAARWQNIPSRAINVIACALCARRAE